MIPLNIKLHYLSNSPPTGCLVQQRVKVHSNVYPNLCHPYFLHFHILYSVWLLKICTQELLTNNMWSFLSIIVSQTQTIVSYKFADNYVCISNVPMIPKTKKCLPWLGNMMTTYTHANQYKVPKPHAIKTKHWLSNRNVKCHCNTKILHSSVRWCPHCILSTKPHLHGTSDFFSSKNDTSKCMEIQFSPLTSVCRIKSPTLILTLNSLKH